MNNSLDKATRTLAAPSVNRQAALLRRAAQVANTSQLLVNQTEELLAQARQLTKKFGVKPVPKRLA